MLAPPGGAPSNGCEPGGTHSTPSKGRSRWVDDGYVTTHEPAREDKHDVPPGPGSEGTGDIQRVRGLEGGPRANRGGWIVRQPWSGRRGQRKSAGDAHRGARS
jgi:hypothetical protein